MKIRYFATIALMLSSAAIAANNEQKDKTADNPDKLICRTEEVTGSRLGSSKRCLTAAQWEENRMQNRMEIDRAQRSRWKSN